MFPSITSGLTRSLMKHIPKTFLVRQMSNESTQENITHEKCINYVHLLGRVGNDPQKRGTEKHPVVLFSLATNSFYKNSEGETIQNTDWHRICVFRPGLKDTVYNFLKKGQRVCVLGKLNYGEIDDANSGQKIQVTSIIADDIIFFNSKQ